ncbi:MAG: hypothetical protein DRP85_04240 [Candidatus Makaraimicrobium thalassicum]|nr:MAG: hypothetical protein DRP85_04240 [Candidatus Omnitrophota bacterium]
MPNTIKEQRYIRSLRTGFLMVFILSSCADVALAGSGAHQTVSGFSLSAPSKDKADFKEDSEVEILKLLERVRKHFAGRGYAEEDRDVKLVLDRDPAGEEIRRETGGEEELLGRAERVVEYLQKAEAELNSRITEYLQKAEAEIKKGEFDRARDYVKKALKIDRTGHKAIEDRARKLAEEEVRRQAGEKAAGQKRLRRIAGDIEKERERIEKKKLDRERARVYTGTVVEVEEETRKAKDLLSRIEQAESVYQQQQQSLRREEAAAAKEAKREDEQRRRAEREARKRAKEEAELRRQAEKIAGYLAIARERLSENKFDEARRYVKKAFAVNEMGRKVIEEREERRREREEEAPAKAAEAAKPAETAAARKRAKSIAGYLKSASKNLEDKRFDRARHYAQRALDIEKDNEDARGLLADIDRSENDFRAEQERLRREKKASRRREEEARGRAREEAAARKREERIAGYLEKARGSLEDKRFDRARRYAQRALDIGKDNEDARGLLADIDRSENAYEAEQERLRREEKASRRREEEARVRAREEAAARKREERVAGYLEKARGSLEDKRFDRARRYARKALEVEKDDRRAQEQLADIEEAERAYRAGRERIKRAEHIQEGERRIKKKAELAAREHAKREAVRKPSEGKVKGHISRSRRYLSKRDYSNARRYAYLARDEAPEDSEVAALITEIDKEEMFGKRKREEEARKKRTKKALKEAEKKADAFHRYDEGKGWMDHIAEKFTKKTFELGDVQEGREYEIDECVQLAMHRSQRMIVADKQVKLAEMRLWEARRELFPSVTGKIERSTGRMGAGDDTRHYMGEKYQLEIKHNIFDGMGSWFSLQQTKTNLEIVKLEREKIENEIVEETKVAYYNLDKAVKALTVQEEFKKNVNRLYDLVRESYQHELLSRAEYLKVKGQNVRADFQYISSGEDVTLAEMVLFQAINIEPDRHIKIKPVEEPGEAPSIGLENCQYLAIANRPDIRIKGKMIEYYDLERKMNKAKGWPKIDFQGSFGKSYETWQPTDDETERRGLSPEWFAGIKGSVPIWGNTFEYNYVREKWAPVVSSVRGTESATSYLSIKFLDDLAYFSNLQESRVGFESAKQEYLKAKKDLAMEVKESYFKYRKALLQMDVARAQLEHQGMFVDILEERRRFGDMEASKVIEEYEKLAEYKYGAVQGEASYYITLTKLSKAIGIADYFKPEYESREYEDWKKKAGAAKPAEVPAVKEIEVEEKAAAGAGGYAKEGQAARKAKEDAAARKRAANYLQKARDSLKVDKFDRARGYAGKALKVDAGSKAASDQLADIDRAEKAYREEQERLKREEEGRKKREEDARKRAKEEAAVRERTERAAGYLTRAWDSMKLNKFDKARGYVEKALKVDGDTEAAQERLADIDRAEKAYEAEQERLEREKAPGRRKEHAERSRKTAKGEAAERKRTDHIAAYLRQARDSLKDKKFSKARGYAKKALKVDKDSRAAREQLAGIDRSEKDYRVREERRKKAEEEARRREEIETHLVRAEEYLKKKDFSLARKYAGKALRLDPGNKKVKQFLADIDRAEADIR